jgi:hypothetical protein
MPDDMPPRITEDDRDSAVKRLQEAFVEGHISHDEMDERLQAVLTAKTHGELVPALASLPDNSTGPTSKVAAKSGRIQRRGAWRVPRVLRVESEYGRVNLDLSRAIIENPVVDIELELRYGKAKITLPRDRSSTSRICAPSGSSRSTRSRGASTLAGRGSGSPGPWSTGG